MWNAPSSSDTVEKSMVLDLDTIENSGEPFAPPPPLNSVAMKHGGMGRQARPYGRNPMVRDRIDKPGQSLPVRLVGKRRSARFRARNNQAVEMVLPQLAGGSIM